MYQNEIGKSAGEIWRYLEKNDATSAEKIQKDLKHLSKDLFNQALGWLARENQIDINTTVKPITISKKH